MLDPKVPQIDRDRTQFGFSVGRHSLRMIAVIAVLTILAASGPAASPPSAGDEPRISITPRRMLPTRKSMTRPSLRLDVKMVLIPVTVTDLWDRPIKGLAANSFHVTEDNVEQKIASIVEEDGPVSVGFIFDASSSMKKRMAPSIAAIGQFLKEAEEGDEFFLVRFSDKPTLVTGFTSDARDILSELPSMQAQGWTAMLDAICLGVQQLRHAKNARRALFVLSDGGDNSSRYTESEVRNLVRESDLQLYAVGLFEKPHFLAKLAADTGGVALWAHSLKDLPEVIDKISREMRQRYVLGYSSTNGHNDGKYRRVKIEVVPPDAETSLNVSWRRGYYAPVE
ncbi:MAG TPA: VWA domain-containing protein [Bryobacteraceae bacterium]|nr:VWA domain-containing protein [Bryobacteraceae bacterium]